MKTKTTNQVADALAKTTRAASQNLSISLAQKSDAVPQTKFLPI